VFLPIPLLLTDTWIVQRTPSSEPWGVRLYQTGVWLFFSPRQSLQKKSLQWEITGTTKSGFHFHACPSSRWRKQHLHQTHCPRSKALSAPLRLELCVTCVLGTGESRMSCNRWNEGIVDCKRKKAWCYNYKQTSAQEKELLCRENLNDIQEQSTERAHLWER